MQTNGAQIDGHFVGFQLSFNLKEEIVDRLEADLAARGIQFERAGTFNGMPILYVDINRALESVDLLEKHDGRRCTELRKELYQWTR